MKLIKLHARIQGELTTKAVYVNPEHITAINSTPTGTLVQCGQLAYMVKESIPEIYKGITGVDLVEVIPS